MTIPKITIAALVISLVLLACNHPTTNLPKSELTESSTKVTPENFIRAETDHMFSAMIKNAGGSNQFFHFRTPTPLDKQTVIRMNRDVLYSGGVFDAREGLTITFPEITDTRYASMEIIDNDHYVIDIIHEPGTYHIQSPTDFVYIIIRIQLKSPDDQEDIAIVNALQDQFVVTSKSNQPFQAKQWDTASLDSLRVKYLDEGKNYDGYKGMMGKRGTVNEKTRHIAAAGGWGLLPDEEATYLLFQDPDLNPEKSYSATFEIPENEGFWSITVYGKDGYIKNDNSYLSASNVKYDETGTFTVCFGDQNNCNNAPNKLYAPVGWNFLLRIYRPGSSVLNGSYKLPELIEN